MLFLLGCWPVDRPCFVPVNPFHARQVREQENTTQLSSNWQMIYLLSMRKLSVDFKRDEKRPFFLDKCVFAFLNWQLHCISQKKTWFACFLQKCCCLLLLCHDTGFGKHMQAWLHLRNSLKQECLVCWHCFQRKDLQTQMFTMVSRTILLSMWLN